MYGVGVVVLVPQEVVPILTQAFGATGLFKGPPKISTHGPDGKEAADGDVFLRADLILARLGDVVYPYVDYELRKLAAGDALPRFSTVINDKNPL
jgi:hypothetical protein